MVSLNVAHKAIIDAMKSSILIDDIALRKELFSPLFFDDDFD